MGYVKGCCYFLVTTMVFMLVFSYASLTTLIQTSRENTQRVLQSYITQNSKEIYQSIKNHNEYIVELDQQLFANNYLADGTLEYKNNHLYHNNGEGDYLYKMTVPQVKFTVNNSLNLTCNYTMSFPIQFAGIVLSDLNIPISVMLVYGLK